MPRKIRCKKQLDHKSIAHTMDNSHSQIRYTADNKSAVQARSDAQRIAFGPFVFQAAKALCDLGILEHIESCGTSGATVEDICRATGLKQYGVQILLDSGLSAELVHTKGDKFVLNKTGYFLLNDAMSKINMNFTHDVCYEGLFYLQDSIKQEKPVGLKKLGTWETLYQGLRDFPKKAQDSWLAFDHYYSDCAFPVLMPEIFRNKPKTLIDVGGNTGRWATECLQYDASIHITIMDLPQQLSMAEASLTKQGLAHRVTLTPVDFLQPIHDFEHEACVIWMSQFLDCFPPKKIIEILTAAKAAMTPESSLFILETYWDRQRHEAAALTLHSTSLYFNCLANGNSRMYHSEQMLSLVHEAGLVVVKDTDDIGVGHTLFESKLPA